MERRRRLTLPLVIVAWIVALALIVVGWELDVSGAVPRWLLAPLLGIGGPVSALRSMRQLA